MLRGIIFYVLALGICLAAPQQDDSDFDNLLNGVFPSPGPKTSPTTESGGDVINSSVFKPNKTGETRLFLGSQNGPTTRSDCECVRYDQCKNGKITEDGVDLLDIRSGGECEHYMDVCCKPPDRKDPIVKVTTDAPMTSKGCGRRKPKGVQFRITGHQNNEAQFGEFPWMVVVLSEQITSNGSVAPFFVCGGALIHPKAVLTAAHCVNDKLPAQLSIRAGEWDTQTQNEILPYQNRRVESVIMHENFKPNNLRNDFAILLLRDEVEIAEHIDTICLPDVERIPIDESNCFVSGWGKDIFGKEGKYQVILKRIELPIVQHDTCETALRHTRLGKYFVLHDSFICAGGEAGKDACEGDGGSPLVCSLKNDPSRYVQAGIVAWGIGCGEENNPGVYANVAFARTWIDQQMLKLKLGTTTYQYTM